ncbi:M-phase phosphoprotein 6 [Anopheles ziemanni]|uniref:M-phase phosphoprotein 6 n=1 Tax=Anopheles coustani TaxID=139045 RepID=UPI0026588006|nr:M-phase phosphoprotein 6 [Anopheles coustani]XP_058171573.1 M-phase phosphoprotein 6 [Anopheles ziemanni]
MSGKMNKVKLSKGILQMKFMSRTKEKVEKEADAEKGRALYASEITDKMLHESIKYILEPSYVPCEDLIDGRVSYGGMNPEIERIIAIETGIDIAKQQREEAVKDAKMTTDVPDAEMAKFYSTVVNSMNKKYQTKPKRLQHPLPLNIKRSK